MTHACFKALLFLCAGSVIMGMHHDQDIRNMGGIRRYMPVTWITFLVGGLALSGIPGFAGFYSKDSIIEAAHLSTIPGAGIAYYSALFSVFVTGFYTFRLYFIVFHGKERMNDHTRKHLRETPWVVTVPLTMLAIPSVFLGYFAIEPLLFGGFFDDAIYIAPGHDVLRQLGAEFHGPLEFTLHGFLTPACWLAFTAIGLTFVMYMLRPRLADLFQRRFSILYRILERKYGFDDFNQAFFAAGSRLLGGALWKYADAGLIDGVIVNGSANAVGWVSCVVRRVQSGYLYHYAFAMILGLLGLLTWVLTRN
jgi:NADH-quinone oxidoreductase subunit L